ncbi:MAG: 16S rRNA pseudouridine(516) synthase [Pseudomonadota bacterium]
MQLERILQSQGFGTRKACRALIRHGAVEVAGRPCDDPFAEFDPEGLAFRVAGADWRYRPKAYLMLNKPSGYECSRSPRHHPGVLSLLPAPLLQRGVQPVGRLDEDTTGLLLLSDDGEFIHRLISPKHKVPKVYEVATKHEIDDAQLAALRGGVQLHDSPEPVAALACEAIGAHSLSLTLGEGRYHQVKRMVAAAGNRVVALRRVRVGGLALPADLAEGEWRWLEAADLERLWQGGLAA